MSKSEHISGSSGSHQSLDETIGPSSPSITTLSKSLSSGQLSIRIFRRNTRGFGFINGDNAVRKRYLYRLGINQENCGSDAHSDCDNITRNNKAISKVLLRKSVQYTTELKFDKTDPLDIENISQHTVTPTSTWDNLLAIDEVDVYGTPAKHCQALDGAYDLFSLPSDSSITSYTRAISSKATSTDSLSEPSSFNSNMHASSFSFQSIERRINEIYQINPLCDNSTFSRRKVSFDSTVKTTTIPARNSYSERIRTKLWSNSEDIMDNAIRNELEFAFDGHDWKKIREESDFISITPSSNEKIHPAHFYSKPYSSRSMLSMPLHNKEKLSLLEKYDSDNENEISGLHFCGVFAMEMNPEE